MRGGFGYNVEASVKRPGSFAKKNLYFLVIFLTSER
jgi:hypothetical protein